MTLGVLAVLAMAFVMFAGFWTDWLWYRSVDYSSVFTTTLWTKIGLFARLRRADGRSPSASTSGWRTGSGRR